MNSSTTLSLKVVIKKQKSKVVFAEANSNFIDVLSSFLTLPLGQLVTILSNAPAFGSFNSLRSGAIHVGEPLAGNSDGGVFTINPLSLLITDDLRVAPIETGFLQTLNNLGITDTEGAELQNKEFAQALFILTDLVIKNTQMSSSAAVKPEPGILLHHIQKGDAKSRSVIDSIDNKFFTTPEMKNRLINRKLPYGYIKQNQFLPLHEDALPKLYYIANLIGSPYLTTFHEKDGSLVSSFKLSEENYVKKHTICFVSDDLTVTPSLATSISILNAMGIPLSDLKEMEFHIGLEEALNILKASLKSKTPLTDVLVNPMLNKLPKLEHQPKQERC